MRILLINPPFKENLYVTPPLGIAYIAAVLREDGNDIKVIDVAALNLEYDQIKSHINNFLPEIIGFTSMTPGIDLTIDLIKKVKRDFKNVLIILGGPHATILPEEILKKVPEISVIVRGEGEETIKELVKIIEKDADLSDIRGISFRKNGEVINNPDRVLIKDIDNIPFPARDLLPMDKYKHPLEKTNKFTPIITSRGCPYRCIYCVHNIFGKIYRTRSPKNIIEEIRLVKNEYGIKKIIFYDDTFTLDKKRTIQICDLIIKEELGIEWKCESRVNLIDEDIISKMKKAGCNSIAFGVESGNKEVLELLKKDITIDQVRNAFKLAKKYKIETIAYFMIGLPNDTKKTIEDTLKLAIEIDPDYAHFSIATPFPNTELYDLAAKEGLIESQDLSNFFYIGSGIKPVIKTRKMSSKEILDEWRGVNKKFYMRPKYIIKRMVKSINPKEFSKNFRGIITLLKFFR
jgi:radical SAM superfamily enzyme YgiQ (UPF0313 family)